MSDFKLFPSSRAEALAMLYIQSRKNLSDMAASEIAVEYEKAYQEIRTTPRQAPDLQPGDFSL